jgi:hypothetical protein
LLAEQAKGTEYGCSAPMLLVDSFAVELYLKCLYVLDTNQVPEATHDWMALFKALASETRVIIRDAFNDNVRKDPVLRHLKLVNPQAPALTDFDISLQVAARTFDKRRYLYEITGPGDWFYAHLIRDAIRNVTKLDLRLASTS